MNNTLYTHTMDNSHPFMTPHSYQARSVSTWCNVVGRPPHILGPSHLSDWATSSSGG